MAGPTQVEFIPDEEETKPQAEIEFVPDEEVKPEPKPEPANFTQPVAEFKPEDKPEQTSTAEAAGRGLRSGATYFTDDEADGVFSSILNLVNRGQKAPRELIAGEKPVGEPDSGKSVFQQIKDDYLTFRDETRKANNIAAEEHPYITGVTRVGGAFLNPATYMSGAGAGAAVGAIGGFGASEGDISDIATSTALGAGLGALGGRYAGAPNASKIDKVARPLVRYGLPAAGVTHAIASDDMSTADKVSAVTAGLMAIPGMAGDFAAWRANKAAATGGKARTQLADEIKTGDFADDFADAQAINKQIDSVSASDEASKKAAVNAVRQQEKEALKAAQSNKTAQTAEGIKQQLALMSQEDKAKAAIQSARLAEKERLQTQLRQAQESKNQAQIESIKQQLAGLEQSEKAKSVIQSARQKETEQIQAAKLAEQDAKRLARIKELETKIKTYKKSDLAQETIAKARQQEAAELQVLKKEQAQAKLDKQLRALNQKEEELRARQARKLQEAELKAYKGEEAEANKKFQEYVKQQTKITQARAKIRRQRNAARKALEKALAEAEDEAKNIDASAQGVYAQAFQNLDVKARRMAETFKRKGLETPEVVNKSLDIVDDSYIKNPESKLITPEQAEANYRAQLEANNKLKQLNARKALEQFDATPFDENAEVDKLIGNVPNEDFYKYAQSIGLDPGKLEEFDFRKPLPLKKPAPNFTPEPVDPEQDALVKLESQRKDLLNTPEDNTPARKTDEEILKEAGVEAPQARDRVAELEQEIARLQTPEQKQIFARKTDEEILREAGMDVPPDKTTARKMALLRKLQILENTEGKPTLQKKTDEEILREAGIEPPPDKRAVRRMALERKLALLENPAPEQAQNPYFKPESEILKEAGLDQIPPASQRVLPDFKAKADTRAPVENRVQELVDAARPATVDKIKHEATKDALIGGLGAGATTLIPGLPGPQLGVGGAALGAAAGAYVGAKKAIQSLSQVDIKTGKYKNPAAVAAAMDSIKAALMRYPTLRTKYGKAFSQGLSPVQVMFYIKNDPDLARALDENEAESNAR